MVDWYADIGELLAASGEDWFPQTLQGTLQRVFHYDYFLMVSFKRDGSLRIIRSDFRNKAITLALRYFETETYVVDPIYRLFNAGRITQGVFDMAELAMKCRDLPEPTDLSLNHMVSDIQEEVGFRTIGWPKYLQESCILCPHGHDTMIAISLYNFGLEKSGRIQMTPLRTIYPALAPIVSKHFDALARKTPTPNASNEDITNAHSPIEPASESDVRRFFTQSLETEITSREAVIFTRLLQGMTVPAISDNLGISIHTAKTHRRNVYRKIGHGRILELINQFHAFTQNVTPAR